MQTTPDKSNEEMPATEIPVTARVNPPPSRLERVALCVACVVWLGSFAAIAICLGVGFVTYTWPAEFFDVLESCSIHNSSRYYVYNGKKSDDLSSAHQTSCVQELEYVFSPPGSTAQYKEVLKCSCYDVESLEKNLARVKLGKTQCYRIKSGFNEIAGVFSCATVVKSVFSDSSTCHRLFPPELSKFSPEYHVLLLALLGVFVVAGVILSRRLQRAFTLQEAFTRRHARNAYTDGSLLVIRAG